MSYVFDVPAASLGKSKPQAVNPMLSTPTKGKSVVWLKLSNKDPYVVCFEGPLNKGNNGEANDTNVDPFKHLTE